MIKSISDMLGMEVVESDATNVALEPIEVFGEKSQDADIARDDMIKLAIDIAMGSTPIGGTVKAGKGAMSFLKGLLGKAKSKYKFPVGYGEPTQGMRTADRKMLEKFFEQRKLKEVLSRIDKPEQFSKIDKTLERTPSKGTVEWMELQKALKPKGMRQFGKFNRQKWEKYENGGRVEVPSLDEFVNLHRKVFPNFDEYGEEAQHSFDIMKQYFDPEYYKKLEEEWGDDKNILSEVITDTKDYAINYMNELESRLDERESRTQPTNMTFIPKEKEKQEGLMALLQRLLPGGKTGYKE